MAQIESSTIGCYMGDPMVCVVKSMSPDVPNIAFHRVKLAVSVAWTDSRTNRSYSYSTELSHPVSNPGESITFDFSSVARAAADEYEHAPLITSSIISGSTHDYLTKYPVFFVSYYAYDVWVSDGQPNDPSVGSNQTAPQSASVLYGKSSDFTRMIVNNIPSLISVYRTTKPSRTPEIKAVGEYIIYGKRKNSDWYPCAIKVPANWTNTSLFENGSKYYVVDHHDRVSCEFQFVNSCGVIESVTAQCLSNEKAVSSHTDLTISRFETFRDFSRTFMQKHIKPTEYTLSSGFVDYDWACWWAYEFCQSHHYWMLVHIGSAEYWIPCLIHLEDSTSVIDRTKVGMCHVEFTVRPDLNGPVW